MLRSQQRQWWPPTPSEKYDGSTEAYQKHPSLNTPLPLIYYSIRLTRKATTAIYLPWINQTIILISHQPADRQQINFQMRPKTVNQPPSLSTRAMLLWQRIHLLYTLIKVGMVDQKHWRRSCQITIYIGWKKIGGCDDSQFAKGQCQHINKTTCLRRYALGINDT
jgi:hypothetical protein